MKRVQPSRPTPTGANLRGVPVYSGEEVAAYRLLNGFDQRQVADAIGCAQSLLSYYESGDAELQEAQAVQIMKAVEHLAVLRENRIAEGEGILAELAARGKRGTPPEPRGRYRPKARARAILKAQGRGGEG